MCVLSHFSDDVHGNTTEHVDCIEVIDKDDFQEHPIIRW